MVNGPESFTIDTKYLLGDVNECHNYFVAAGMNSSGILASGGVGKMMSGWIIHGHPTLYDEDYKYENPKLHEIERSLFASYPAFLDIKRFHPYCQSTNVLADSNGLVGKQSVTQIRSSPLQFYQESVQNA